MMQLASLGESPEVPESVTVIPCCDCKRTLFSLILEILTSFIVRLTFKTFSKMEFPSSLVRRSFLGLYTLIT